MFCMCACQCSVRPAKTNPACMPRCLRCCLWDWPPTCSCHTHSLCSQPTQWPRGEYRSKQWQNLNFNQKRFKELISTHLVARVSFMTELPILVLNACPYKIISPLSRFVEWIPEVPADVSWLAGVAGDVYRQAWKGAPANSKRWQMIFLYSANNIPVQSCCAPLHMTI